MRFFPSHERADVQMTTTTKAPTKRDNFTTLLVILAAIEADESLSKFVQHEIDLLNKKRGSKKSSALTDEQTDAMDDIDAVLSATEVGMRVGDIHKAGAGKSSQQVTALLAKMVAAGTVVRTEDKGVAYFSLAGE